MEKKIKEELEEFKKLKKQYVFKQKEIIKIGEDLFCDEELLQKEGEKPIGESTKWINVGYNLSGTYSKVLSNLFHYDFVFRGKNLRSIEGFFQGIKFKDIEMQNMVLEYSGIESNCIKVAAERDWKETGIIYWQGKEIKRDSLEYDEMVDELYISAIQNPLYRSILKKIDKLIIHSIGEENKENTVFTRYEFEYMLNALIEFLKER